VARPGLLHGEEVRSCHGKNGKDSCALAFARRFVRRQIWLNDAVETNWRELFRTLL
jgi:hypothetical protein